MILRYAAVVLSLSLSTALSAQSSAPDAVFERARSRNEGVVARLGTAEILRIGRSEKPRDPFSELQRKAGVGRPGQLRSDNALYGVSGYGGYVVPMATVADAAGHLYITGAASDGGRPEARQFTLKLDANGDTLWRVWEAGTKYAAEHGMAIALDAEGAPIVAGSYWNGTDMDIRLTKYGTDGSTLWQSVHTGAGEGLDLPTAMTLDTDGNVLVTGISWSGVSIDYVTLKYDADGSLLWSVTDNGVGGATWNEPADLATDAQGNVYVTGFSENAQYWDCYYTVKYSASGEPLWQQRYTYTGPPSINNSYARAIAVDDAGNAYVTGTIDRGNSRFGTIKYDADGVQQWMETYRSGTELTDAYAIALGPDDIIYVGGERNGEFTDDGFVLVAYSLSGDALWMRETDDLIDFSARHLEVDAEGNAVIAGIGSLMIDPENFIMVRAARAKRYSPAGDPLDEVTHQAAQVDTIGFLGLPGMDVDANNGIALTLHVFYTSQGAKTTTAHFTDGDTDPDWITEVHDSLGLRTRMLNGSVDGAGNSICTGDFLTFTSGFNTTRIVVKHDAEGNIAWDRRYDTATDGPAAGIAAAVGTDGSVRVYLVPENDFSGEPLILRLKKLDADGNELWEAQKALQQPVVYSVVTDAQGNTFLCGSAVPEGADNDAFVVVKFDADGNEAWTTFHAVEGATSHTGGAAVATNDGGVLLPGSAGIGGWFDSDLDFTVVRFNGDGTVAWSTPVEVANGSGGAVEALIDAEGNIYATGAVQDQTTTEYDFLTAKFSSEGAVLWSARHGDTAHDERTYTLKQLSNGDVVVVGYQLAMDEELHNVLIRYAQDGTPQWTAFTPDGYFYRDLEVDGADNSYILDQVYGSTFPYRLFYGLVYSAAVVVKVDAEGNTVEEEEHTGPELSEFYPERLFSHPGGRLVLAGTLMNESFYEGIHLLDSGLELATAVPSLGQDESGAVATAYPNPFRDRVAIPVMLTSAARVSVSVLDAQGRMVQQLPQRLLTAGRHSVVIDGQDLAPGHYLYRINLGDRISTGKLLRMD